MLSSGDRDIIAVKQPIRPTYLAGGEIGAQRRQPSARRFFGPLVVGRILRESGIEISFGPLSITFGFIGKAAVGVGVGSIVWVQLDGLAVVGDGAVDVALGSVR
jgi:hypothetical protein